jgi:energy-coupling factor transporter ATP-binding protein EcfA2
MSSDLFAKLEGLKSGTAKVGAGSRKPEAGSQELGVGEVPAPTAVSPLPSAPAADSAGQSYRIRDVNGIHDFTVTLDKPGVYVARGPNGAGKSSVIEAIKGASGDAGAKVLPTVGEDKGQVDMGGGVLFKVGHKRTKQGQPYVQLVGTSAISELIEPGLIDEDAAARKRTRALLKLMPLPVDDTARLELTRNDEVLQEWIRRDTSLDAMELAENTRLKANELALEQEKRRDECNGQVKSMEDLIAELGDVDHSAGALAAAKAAAEKVMGDANVIVHRAQQRQQHERQIAEIKGTIGERPRHEESEARRKELEAEAVELAAKLADVKMRHSAECAELNRILTAQKVWDAQSEIMKRPVEGPTMAEAEAAVNEAAALKEKAGRAEKLDQFHQWNQKAEAAKLEATTRDERAKLLRDIAKGVEGALSRLLERRGLGDLAMVNGRLHWNHNGKLLDYGSQMVSFGQRVRIALGVALKGIDRESVESRTTGNRMPLLAINPDFWLALDPLKKAEVAEISKERGVCLITEEPGEGELRIEKVA